MYLQKTGLGQPTAVDWAMTMAPQVYEAARSRQQPFAVIRQGSTPIPTYIMPTIEGTMPTPQRAAAPSWLLPVAIAGVVLAAVSL